MIKATRTLALIIGVIGTCFVGWANLHTDEPTVVIAFAMPIVLLASAMWGRPTPIFALLVGAAVPVSTLLAYLLGRQTPYPCSPATVYQSCIIFVFTLPAAIFGVLLRKAFSPVEAS